MKKIWIFGIAVVIMLGGVALLWMQGAGKANGDDGGNRTPAQNQGQGSFVAQVLPNHTQEGTASMDGDGSAEYPYLIGDPTALNIFSGLVAYAAGSGKMQQTGNHFKLIIDITVNSGWTPIPLLEDGCVFDGDGHTVTINGVSTPSVGIYPKGLFTNLRGTVKNLIIKPNLRGSIVGAVAATVVGSMLVPLVRARIENVVISGGNELYTYHEDASIGGLVGVVGMTYSNTVGAQASAADCELTIVASYNEMLRQYSGIGREITINNNKANGTYAGGLVGRVDNATVNISYSYNEAGIKRLGSGNSTMSLGGLVGGVLNGSVVNISNCYNSGDVIHDKTGNTYPVGGIVGDVDSTSTVTVTNSANTGNVSGGNPTSPIVENEPGVTESGNETGGQGAQDIIDVVQDAIVNGVPSGFTISAPNAQHQTDNDYTVGQNQGTESDGSTDYNFTVNFGASVNQLRAGTKVEIVGENLGTIDITDTASGGNPYTYTIASADITEDLEIKVTTMPNVYTVTALAAGTGYSGNGYETNSTTREVTHGDDYTFTYERHAAFSDSTPTFAYSGTTDGAMPVFDGRTTAYSFKPTSNGTLSASALVINKYEIRLPNPAILNDARGARIYEVTTNNSQLADAGSEFTFKVVMGANYGNTAPVITGVPASTNGGSEHKGEYDLATRTLTYTFIVPYQYNAVQIVIDEYFPNTHTVTIPSTLADVFTMLGEVSGTYNYGETVNFAVTLDGGGAYVGSTPTVLLNGTPLAAKTNSGLTWNYEFVVTGVMTVSVTAEKDKHTVSLAALAAADGVTSVAQTTSHAAVTGQSNTFSATYGEDFSFSVQYATHYTQGLSEIKLDGETLTPTDNGNGLFEYTFTVDNANVLSITPIYNDYAVTLPAAILPTGVISITSETASAKYNTAFNFTVKYETLYAQGLSEVKYNNGTALVGTDKTDGEFEYTIMVTSANNNITITPVIDKYDVTLPTVMPTGVISIAASTGFQSPAPYGSQFKFTVKYDDLYTRGLSEVRLGVTVESGMAIPAENIASLGNGEFEYTITVGTANVISIVPQINKYAVTFPTAPNGYTITDKTSTELVSHGSTFSFTVSMDNFASQEEPTVYHNATLLTDTTASEPASNGWIYTITVGIENKITVTLNTKKYQITVTRNESHFVSFVESTNPVAYGESYTFTFVLAAPFNLVYNVELDDVDVTNDSHGYFVPELSNAAEHKYTYLFNNIKSLKTIDIITNPNKYYFTLTQTSNGAISLDGVEYVGYDESVTVYITRSSGYLVSGLRLTDTTDYNNQTYIDIAFTDLTVEEYVITGIRNHMNIRATFIEDNQTERHISLSTETPQSNGFTFTLPKNTVSNGGSVQFSVTLDERHNKAVPTIRIVNTDENSAVETDFNGTWTYDAVNKKYTYTYTNIQSDIEIKVLNIIENTYTITVAPENADDIGYTIVSDTISDIAHGATDEVITLTVNASHNEVAPKIKVGTQEIVGVAAGAGVYNFALDASVFPNGITADIMVYVITKINLHTLTIAAANVDDHGFAPAAPIENIKHGTAGQTFTVTMLASHSDEAPQAKIGNGTPFAASENLGSGVYEFVIAQEIMGDLTVYIITVRNTYTLTVLDASADVGIESVSSITVAHGTENKTFTVTMLASHSDEAPQAKIGTNGTPFNASENLGNGVYEFVIEQEITTDLTVYIITKRNTYTVNVIAANADDNGFEFISLQSFVVEHGTKNITVEIDRWLSHSVFVPQIQIGDGAKADMTAGTGNRFAYVLFNDADGITGSATVKIYTVRNTYTISKGTAGGGNSGFDYSEWQTEKVAYDTGVFTFKIKLHDSHNELAPVVRVGGIVREAVSYNDQTFEYTYSVSGIRSDMSVTVETLIDLHDVTLPTAMSGYTMTSDAQKLGIADGTEFKFTVILDDSSDPATLKVRIGGILQDNPTATGANGNEYAFAFDVTADTAVTVNVAVKKLTVTVRAETANDNRFTVVPASVGGVAVTDATFPVSDIEYGKDLVFTVTLVEGYGQSTPVFKTSTGRTLYGVQEQGFERVFKYTLTNITVGEEIFLSGTLILDTFTIEGGNVTAVGWSTTSTDNAVMNWNGSYTFKLNLDISYSNSDFTVTVKDKKTNAVVETFTKADGFEYTIDAIKANLVISVSGVTSNTYKLTVNDPADDGGTITVSPAAANNMYGHGVTVMVTFTPDAAVAGKHFGYRVVTVTIGGGLPQNIQGNGSLTRSVTMTDNITVSATYELIPTSKIYFHNSEENIEDHVENTIGGTYTYFASDFDANLTTRFGYTFTGWLTAESTPSNVTNIVYTTDEKHFYASWTPAVYKLSIQDSNEFFDGEDNIVVLASATYFNEFSFAQASNELSVQDAVKGTYVVTWTVLPKEILLGDAAASDFTVGESWEAVEQNLQGIPAISLRNIIDKEFYDLYYHETEGFRFKPIYETSDNVKSVEISAVLDGSENGSVTMRGGATNLLLYGADKPYVMLEGDVEIVINPDAFYKVAVLKISGITMPIGTVGDNIANTGDGVLKVAADGTVTYTLSPARENLHIEVSFVAARYGLKLVTSVPNNDEAKAPNAKDVLRVSAMPAAGAQIPSASGLESLTFAPFLTVESAESFTLRISTNLIGVNGYSLEGYYAQIPDGKTSENGGYLAASGMDIFLRIDSAFLTNYLDETSGYITIAAYFAERHEVNLDFDSLRGSARLFIGTDEVTEFPYYVDYGTIMRLAIDPRPNNEIDADSVVFGGLNFAEQVSEFEYVITVLGELDIAVAFKSTQYLIIRESIDNYGEKIAERSMGNIDAAGGEKDVEAGEIDDHAFGEWQIRDAEGTLVPLGEVVANVTVIDGEIQGFAVTNEIIANYITEENGQSVIRLVAVFVKSIELNISVAYEGGAKNDAARPYKVWNLHGAESADDEDVTLKLDTLEYLAKLEIRPEAPKNFKFIGYVIDGTEVANDGAVTIEMSAARYVTLKFAPITYEIMYAEPAIANGTVTFDGTEYTIGSVLVISFNANAGYEFSKMTINGIDVASLHDAHANMSFKNSTVQITIDESWMTWAAANASPWLDAGNRLTLDVRGETGVTAMLIGGISVVVVLVAVMAVLIALYMVSLKKKKKDYALALEKSKQSSDRLKAASMIGDVVKNASSGGTTPTGAASPGGSQVGGLPPIPGRE